MSKWKKISSKEVFKHPRLTVVEDEIILPSGKETTYLRFKDVDAATIIAKNEEGKILLSSEYSYPPDDELFQFPGGAVEEHEAIELAAKRELAEETNYVAQEIELLGEYLINNRRSTAKMYLFLAKNLSFEETDGDDEEDIKNFWVTETEIDKMIETGKIVNPHVLACWAIYRSRQNEL